MKLVPQIFPRIPPAAYVEPDEAAPLRGLALPMHRAVARLRRLCAALALSPTDFAQRLALPERRARRVLRPTHKPSCKLMARVARAFPKVSLRWLVLGEGEMFAPAPASNHVGTNHGTVHQHIYYR